MEILRIGNYRFSAPEKNHVKSAKRQLLEIEPRTNCCNVNFSDGAFMNIVKSFINDHSNIPLDSGNFCGLVKQT